MIIKANELSKRFFSESIFKKLTYEFKPGNSYAITGPNGSGKSTLLKVLSGLIPQTKGEIIYRDDNGNTLDDDTWYSHLSFVSPYLELLEEYTLIEFLQFHSKFKKPLPDLSPDKIIEKAGLKSARNKRIHNFSSGMKQRVKLMLAFDFDNEIVFLDEPTTNLDEQGVNWYRENIESILEKRLLFVASNQLKEYEMCTKNLNILDYK